MKEKQIIGEILNMANNRPFTYYTGPTAAGTTKIIKFDVF